MDRIRKYLTIGAHLIFFALFFNSQITPKWFVGGGILLLPPFSLIFFLWSNTFLRYFSSLMKFWSFNLVSRVRGFCIITPFPSQSLYYEALNHSILWVFDRLRGLGLQTLHYPYYQHCVCGFYRNRGAKRYSFFRLLSLPSLNQLN